MADQIAALGGPAGLVDAWRSVEPDVFHIHHDNADIFRLFRACGTQWRHAVLSTMGSARIVHTGLDYTAAAQVARLMAVALTPADFADLQLMEASAISAAAKKID